MDSKDSVFKLSEGLPEGISVKIKGYDFNKGIDYNSIFESYLSTGIQSSNFKIAIDLINQMIENRDIKMDESIISNEREIKNCTIILGYSSNILSFGNRDIIKFLTQHRLIDVIVTTGFRIEEDFLKCFKEPNVNDINMKFEKWLTFQLDKCFEMQQKDNFKWTPSKFIKYLGKVINNKDSVYYWCAKNDISVFCPTLFEGNFWKLIHSHCLKNNGAYLNFELCEDMMLLDQQCTLTENTGVIILGSEVKHIIETSANFNRGCNYSVQIYTSNESEICDRTVSLNEETSCGNSRSTSLRLYADASLVFPIIVSQTFAKKTSLNLCNSKEEENNNCNGYDFNKGINYDEFFNSFLYNGIQASNFKTAIDIINKMLENRNEILPAELDKTQFNPVGRQMRNCTIFLGYTSNMISSGIRDIIRYLAQHNLVDVIVTSGGGIEEDFIKCLGPSYLGDYTKFKDTQLRKNGINRIGNMLVPNNNYVEFEKWLTPHLDKCLEMQQNHQVKWTPSKFIKYLGEAINNEESIYYWCAKNNIPVFCPALTDGSIGDMIYFHSLPRKGQALKFDINEDIVLINKQATLSARTGMLILGGGVIKHHIANANLMRDGSDYSVYINTGNEFESSDSGAPPAEAISWGKIKATSDPVKLYSEISLVFPLIVAQTFAKYVERNKSNGDIYI